MIWIGCLVLLSAACALLVIQRFVIVRRIRRHIDRLNATFEGPARLDRLNATFEGPARLELFGHVTHVGWVRQGAERIDVLTIEGEALQCDARARYRLTPLTWKELVGECLRRKEDGAGGLEHEIRALKVARDEAEERRVALRCAIGDALEQLSGNCPATATTILDIAREKDEEHDAVPF